MRAHFGLPSIAGEEGGEQWKAPIEVKFEIPYFTVSGLQVILRTIERLNVIELTQIIQFLGNELIFY